MNSAIRVAIHAEWAGDDRIYRIWSRYLPASRRWGRIQFVHRQEPHDWLVIFNYPRIPFDPQRTFLYQHEPQPIRRKWPAPWNDPPPDAVAGCYTIPRLYMPFHWYGLYDKDWEWLTTHEIAKTKMISAVISDKTLFEGSRDRVAFVRHHLEKITPQVDLYGRCARPPSPCYRGMVADKSEALLPYRYTIACENSYERNYFTEKLIDGIVSECLTFYSGCPNIGDFIPADCYVTINLKEPREAVASIQKEMEAHRREAKIEAIRREKHRILYEKLFFAMLERHIEEMEVSPDAAGFFRQRSRPRRASSP